MGEINIEEIERNPDKQDWISISRYQKLSEEFIEKFSDKIHKEIQKENFKEKSEETKLKEMEKYAKKHNLKIEDGWLFVFRNHDNFGRGSFNPTIFYDEKKEYRDWRCCVNEKNENSFGLGIWPIGNAKIKIHFKDWGCEVNRENGKARVLAFTLI